MATNETSVEGKVIVITGANTGIGFETALTVAKLGGEVIIACRDQIRGLQALEKIKDETKNEKICLELLDLADFDSVREFSKKFLETRTRLDVLINNAGIFNMTFEKNKHGIEMDFAANHLGHFLLTNLLIDLLKRTPGSRIVNVSSAAYKSGKMNWEDLNLEKNFSSFGAYSQSKLCNVLFTLELAKRFEGITSVSLHPGAVKTEIFRNSSGLTGLIIRALFLAFGKNASQGAKTSIFCATSPEIEKNSGAYYDNSKIVKLSKELIESPDGARLWELSF